MAAGSVLVVGAGGLGSPVCLYLAAAGVGTIGIVDADRVSVSDLHRQVVHAGADVGRFKTDSAAAKLSALNPDVAVRRHTERLIASNATAILRDYGFIIEATDNFRSKFLLADACHFTRKPYSHAGVLSFEGQTMTVLPGKTACYRCVFGGAPGPGGAPDSPRAGVFGVLPGIVGCIQAAEALKFLLGAGELLTNRLLVCDALKMEFRVVALQRNPRCPLCGNSPSIMHLGDGGAPAACDI